MVLKNEWRNQSSPIVHIEFWTYRSTRAIGLAPLEEDALRGDGASGVGGNLLSQHRLIRR